MSRSNSVNGSNGAKFELLIDLGGLSDEDIPDRKVGLKLVVVVIGDEVLNGILREELAQLVAVLCRQGFVVGNNQGLTSGLGDNVVHHESLAVAPSRV